MAMNRWTRVLCCGAIGVSVVLSAACSSDSHSHAPGKDHGVASAKVDDHATTPAPVTGEQFLLDHIPHHEGAVAWAKLVIEKAEHPELREFGEATLKGASNDIATMKKLVPADKLEKARSHGGEHFGPDGIEALRKGTVTDKELLDWMIDHHEVGVPSTAVLSNSANESQEVKALVESINERFLKGLDKMKAWRTAWYGPSTSTSTTGR